MGFVYLPCITLYAGYRRVTHMSTILHAARRAQRRCAPSKQNTIYSKLGTSFLRKEVIQPHLPIRLPCYDFTPVAGFTFGSSLLKGWVTDFGRIQLPWCDGRCVQGPGTYSPRHADPRLLAIPTSCRRVAACNPNWGLFLWFAPHHCLASLCKDHCSTCEAQDVRGMMI